jgi:hypothetical protein
LYYAKTELQYVCTMTWARAKQVFGLTDDDKKRFECHDPDRVRLDNDIQIGDFRLFVA